MHNKPHSEETKRKISLKMKGRIPWLKGLKTGLIPRNAFQKGHTPWNKGTKGLQVAWNKDKEYLAVKGDKNPAKRLEVREKLCLAAYTRPPQKFPFTNTSIEIRVQNLLKENNIEFETNYPIFGRPDIFIKPNICVFADGCYWHKCSDCGFGHLRERDKQVTEELQKQGYTVIRLWEHDIKNNQFNNLNQLLKC